MLFFGIVRRYKGVDTLLHALRLLLEEKKNFHLTIAGEIFSKSSRIPFGFSGPRLDLESMIQELGLKEHVTLDLRYIPNSEVAGLFEKSDLAIFPFRSISQSGSLMVAYSFNKPVIVTDLGAFRDSVVEGGTGYFAKAEDHESLANAIIRFMEHPISPASIKEVSRNYSWEKYAETILSRGADSL